MSARGFLFDVNLCTGCSACELACSTENDLGWGRSWRRVIGFNPERRPGLPAFHLSLACQHCEEAPCLERCPALAIRRDTRTGTVQIDADRCIGCRYCAWVCPFDAPLFDEDSGVMGKCTLCSHRLEEERTPACVESCPTSALRFGTLEGEASIPGFPPSGARPAIRFTPLSQGMSAPETTWSPDPKLVASFAAARPAPSKEISLRSEWPLLVFTLAAAALAGWIGAAAFGGPSPTLTVFAAAAALAMGTSTLHLGRKTRAWRALLNLRGSWLSREIAAFVVFAALACAFILSEPATGGAAGPQPATLSPAAGMLHGSAQSADGTPRPQVRWLGLAAALAGLAALFCIDRVYDPVRSGGPAHSADTVLTGVLVAALLARAEPVATLLLAAKAVLYMRRHALGESGTDRRAVETRLVLASFRVGAGLLVPLALLLTGSAVSPEWLLAAVALGEVIDRVQFYGELRIRCPRDELEVSRVSAAVAASS